MRRHCFSSFSGGVPLASTVGLIPLLAVALSVLSVGPVQAQTSVTVPSLDLQRDTRFGTAMTPVPDVSGDGTPDFAIGTPSAAVEGTRGVGQAFLFSGAERASIATLSPSEAEPGSEFGDGLTVLDGAQRSTSTRVAVGAPGTGTVHLFTADGSRASTLQAPDAVGRPDSE